MEAAIKPKDSIDNKEVDLKAQDVLEMLEDESLDELALQKTGEIILENERFWGLNERRKVIDLLGCKRRELSRKDVKSCVS